MISGEQLFSNLLAVTVLIVLAIIIYCKTTNKTLVELIRDIREAFASKAEEVIEVAPNAWEDIR